MTKAKTIDVEFVQGTDNTSVVMCLGKGTLVYGSPHARKRTGVAFDTPDTMLHIAKSMEAFAMNWAKVLEAKKLQKELEGKE